MVAPDEVDVPIGEACRTGAASAVGNEQLVVGRPSVAVRVAMSNTDIGSGDAAWTVRPGRRPNW
ncbi:hypothetical protein GTA26_27850 [Rhodococcus hoagii]|nr:hypothetical protein [Prescottella equi]